MINYQSTEVKAGKKKDIKEKWIWKVLKGSVSPPTWASDSAFVACSMWRNNLVKSVVHGTRWSHKDRERLVNSFCEGKSHQADLAVQCATITGTLGPALAVSLSHNVFTPTFNPLKALGALIDGGKHYQRVYHWPHTSGQNGYEDTKGYVSLREGQAERLGCDFS